VRPPLLGRVTISGMCRRPSASSRRDAGATVRGGSSTVRPRVGMAPEPAMTRPEGWSARDAMRAGAAFEIVRWILRGDPPWK
jgi:hypothetical protein